MLGVNHTVSPTALARANQKRARKSSGKRAVTRKVERAIRALIEDGCNLKQAAEAAGMTYRSLYDALRKPEVIAYFKREMEVFRNSARAGNIRVGVEIRDDPGLKDSAAGQKVRLEAAKYIDGADEAGRVQVNVGVSVQNMPGYLVDTQRYDPAAVAQVLASAGSGRTIDMQPRQQAADEAKPLAKHVTVQPAAPTRDE